MQGAMMNLPLSIIDLLKHGAEAFPTEGIVSVRTEGDVHRQTYKETLGRAAKLAHALGSMGVGKGTRVATLAWNGHRHFELYYAISGIGAVCHTINPRLSAEQMSYVISHAEDQVLFTDTTFVPLLQKLAPILPSGLEIVVMTDQTHMPDCDYGCYETLLDGMPEHFEWPVLPETTASGLCYTSGTTGNPKGVLYSHRSTVLHAMYIGLTLPGSLHAGARILPVVPMFHVNSWGLPYAAPLVGASLITPGPKLDGESLFDLMEIESVTAAWGVPTVWLGLKAEMQKRAAKPTKLRQLVIGGSAAARSLIGFFEDQQIDVCHAWGMTETSPVGTHGILPPGSEDLPLQRRLDLKCKQGRRVFGVDLKILDETGNRLPHDGHAVGELFVRGNAVASGYFNNEDASAAALDAEGWFGTGDVASIDPDGYLSIRDRSKDLVKSGGEWISSIDLENIALGHAKVANCAVIAVPHPKWEERPLLVVVPSAPDDPPTLAELHEVMSAHVAKWQLPDALEIVTELPMTATGKVSKLTLRKTFEGYQLVDAD